MGPEPHIDEPSSAIDLTKKQQILLEDKLEKQRLLIDRGLIGALLIMLGFVSNYLIAEYNVTSKREQFFLEKRLEKTNDLRESMSSVTGNYYRISRLICNAAPVSNSLVEELHESVLKFVDKANSSSLLLSDSYLKTTKHIVDIFTGIVTKSGKVPCDARYFIEEVTDYYTHLTRIELGGVKKPKWTKYVPKDVSAKKVDEMSAGSYFDLNFAAWGKKKR